MSIRSDNDDSARTQVSAVHVRLGDPGVSHSRRLSQVVESSTASKAEVASLSAEAMMDYGVMVFALWELLQRSRLDRLLAPSYNVLVSNVPGPGDENLYLCGSRMVASYPISTLLPGVNLNVTLLSHGNSLDFGLLADRHALPDLGLLADAISRQFVEMEKTLLARAVKQQTASRTTTDKKNANNKPAVKERAKAPGKAKTKTRTRTRTRTKPAAKSKTTPARKARPGKAASGSSPGQRRVQPKSRQGR
jgi:hypothetical protein